MVLVGEIVYFEHSVAVRALDFQVVAKELFKALLADVVPADRELQFHAVAGLVVATFWTPEIHYWASVEAEMKIKEDKLI